MTIIHYIHAITNRNHTDFNYIGIPEDCAMPDKLKFDQEEMNRLFELGKDLAKSGCKWHKKPPAINVLD